VGKFDNYTRVPVKLGYTIEDIRKRSTRGEVDRYNVDKFDNYTRGPVRLEYTIDDTRIRKRSTRGKVDIQSPRKKLAGRDKKDI
jgi:hypothetical protein